MEFLLLRLIKGTHKPAPNALGAALCAILPHLNKQLLHTMKTDIITRLESLISDDCKTIDREQEFRESLDSEGVINVRGLTFRPSRIWEELDPIAFGCGVNDYADGENWVEIDGDYYDGNECETKKEELISELESEVSDLESRIEDAEGDEDPDQDSIKESQDKIDALNAQISDLNKHSF